MTMYQIEKYTSEHGWEKVGNPDKSYVITELNRKKWLPNEMITRVVPVDVKVEVK